MLALTSTDNSYGLLGTGVGAGEVGGGDPANYAISSKALRPAKQASGGEPATAKQFVYFATCSFNSYRGQSHRDSVHRTNR